MQTGTLASFDLARLVLISLEITPPRAAFAINNGITDAWTAGAGHRAYRIGRLLLEVSVEPLAPTIERIVRAAFTARFPQREAVHG